MVSPTCRLSPLIKRCQYRCAPATLNRRAARWWDFVDCTRPRWTRYYCRQQSFPLPTRADSEWSVAQWAVLGQMEPHLTMHRNQRFVSGRDAELGTIRAWDRWWHTKRLIIFCCDTNPFGSAWSDWSKNKRNILLRSDLMGVTSVKVHDKSSDWVSWL